MAAPPPPPPLLLLLLPPPWRPCPALRRDACLASTSVPMRGAEGATGGGVVGEDGGGATSESRGASVGVPHVNTPTPGTATNVWNAPQPSTTEPATPPRARVVRAFAVGGGGSTRTASITIWSSVRRHS